MHISFFQAFLIGVVYYLGNIGTPWLSLLGSISVVYKPLVAVLWSAASWAIPCRAVSLVQLSTCLT